MYVRPPNYRYPPSVRVPENYGGSAFREPPQPVVNTTEVPEDAQGKQILAEEELAASAAEPKEESEKSEQASLLSPHGFHLRLGSLFGKDRGIGTEELLIIALIILLADNDSGNFDDLILMLALLFFIK